MNDLNTFQVAEILEANFAKLSERDQEFAQSLLTSIKRYNGISSKQEYWLRQLAERSTAKPAEKVKIDLKSINALFDKAAANLKHPSIVIADDEQSYRLSVASDRASVPGSINVTSLGSFSERQWYGRIHPSTGVFQPSGRGKQPAGLVSALEAFAADPAGVAAVYGRKTGSCCFCSRELTDGRSIEVGYGPVCADRYGLSWGEAKAV